MSSKIEQDYLANLDRIRDLSVAIKKNSSERRKLYSKREKIRAEYIVAIGSEKDEKGKLKFSNEKMRDAELVLRSQNNPQYMDIQQKCWEIDEAGDDLAAEHNRLTDIKYLHMVKLGIPLAIDAGDDEFVEVH